MHGLISERDAEAQAAAAGSKLTDLDLIFEATQRYFALLAAGQKEKVFQKAVQQRTEQLHGALAKASVALTPEIDVFTAKAALARARTNLFQAANDTAVARVALDNAIAVSSNAPFYEVADVVTYKPVAGDVQTYFS